MDRRKFVSTLGLGVAGTALAGCAQSDCAGPSADAGSADANKTYHWKMVTTWPKNYPGLGTGPEKFAKMVNTMSAGRITIKVYGAKELVPAMEVFDAVSQGSAELGHGAAYYWKGKHPATPFFTAVPFGFTAQEMNSWLSYGGGQQLWDELYEGFNLKPFACGNTGTQLPGWYNREINSVSDLAGLKIRMPGLAGEVLKRLGATPVQLPGGEVFTALESGAIDAADWVGPYNDLTFGFYKVAKYYYHPGWHEPGPTLELIMNNEVWNALPEDLQAIVRAAAAWANDDMLSEYTARNNAALIDLQEKHGVQLRRLPDDVLKALKKESDIVLDELTRDNPFARRVFDSYQTFRAGVSSYSNVAEAEYLAVRAALAE
ncbi:MAG: TRAP transporter substrate-binding protein [Gammaproteobacteria bacterium]|jgi:TRAP-type mannitol/chloroaromatic compound transport system substrate-binding protein|nr:TRAP transporter substrate-binding protein [Gammaproteobacteria bacterium]MBQ0774368.1 TRAP transporter substrate-binding protein [Gammaproteobacteria bacterium]